jgi:uncharacterized RDD family membrane protein YckC
MANNGSPPEHSGELEGQSLWQMLNAPDAGEDELKRKRRLAAERAAEEGPAQAEPTAKLPVAEASVAPTPWERRAASDPATTEATQRVSNLQKALSDPSLLGDGESLVASGQDERKDYDDAVSRFYRESAVAVACRNHPDHASIAQCPTCSAYFCQECMVVRRGKLVCRDCATAAYVPTEDEILAAHEKGLEAPESDVRPEEKPEFQVSAVWLGLEGRPAHPLKSLGAILIDLAVTRVLVLVVMFVLGLMFSQLTSPLFHLFDRVDGVAAGQRIIDALILLKPLIPWLIVFAIVDFLYYFITLSFVNRTLGMSWLGCRLVTEWGEFVPFSAVALRTLVFMVCLGAPAVLIGWFFPGFRGPHDYAAGTVVINYAGVKRVDAYEAVQIKL